MVTQNRGALLLLVLVIYHDSISFEFLQNVLLTMIICCLFQVQLLKSYLSKWKISFMIKSPIVVQLALEAFKS